MFSGHNALNTPLPSQTNHKPYRGKHSLYYPLTFQQDTHSLKARNTPIVIMYARCLLCLMGNGAQQQTVFAAIRVWWPLLIGGAGAEEEGSHCHRTWSLDPSCIDQSEASIEVMWSVLTNERPVNSDRDNVSPLILALHWQWQHYVTLIDHLQTQVRHLTILGTPAPALNWGNSQTRKGKLMSKLFRRETRRDHQADISFLFLYFPSLLKYLSS